MEICKSFEYVLDAFSKSTDTALSWLMPISLAYYVVQEDRDHARWIRKKLDGFEGKIKLPVFYSALEMMKCRAAACVLGSATGILGKNQ